MKLTRSDLAYYSVMLITFSLIFPQHLIKGGLYWIVVLPPLALGMIFFSRLLISVFSKIEKDMESKQNEEVKQFE